MKGFKRLNTTESEHGLGLYNLEEESNLIDSFEAPNLCHSDNGDSSNFEVTLNEIPEDTRLNGEQGNARSDGAQQIDRNIRLAMPAGGYSSGDGNNITRSSETRVGQGSSSSLMDSASNEEVGGQVRRGGGIRLRVMNAFHRIIPIKQTYERINNGLTTGRMHTNVPGRFVGQGTDGVFRNLMAKPDTESNRFDEENIPPSYEEAAADATPEYWESTVVSPMYEDEVFVEGLPVGNIANLIWNILVTTAFQFVGFILCYLLHTSHAAKHGSRCGLGISFIYAGIQIIPSNFGHINKSPLKLQPDNPNAFDVDKSLQITKGSTVDNYKANLSHSNIKCGEIETDTPYFAYGVIAFGIFIMIKSLVDYYKVKQMESVILSPPSNTNMTMNSTTSRIDEMTDV